VDCRVLEDREEQKHHVGSLLGEAKRSGSADANLWSGRLAPPQERDREYKRSVIERDAACMHFSGDGGHSHSTIQRIMRYSHLVPKVNQAAVDAMDAFYESGSVLGIEPDTRTDTGTVAGFQYPAK
jgi:hypothetical protein